MSRSDVLKTAGRVVTAVRKVELETEPGRINAISLAVLFVLIVVLGINSVYEETIARIFPGEGDYQFPVVPVIAIFTGAFLVCVALLALLLPLVPPRRKDRDG